MLMIFYDKVKLKLRVSNIIKVLYDQPANSIHRKKILKSSTCIN